MNRPRRRHPAYTGVEYRGATDAQQESSRAASTRSARNRRIASKLDEVLGPVEQERCPNHDAAHVCDECPEAFDTDGRGFVHRVLLRGRTPLRRCHVCKAMTPQESWGSDRCDSCGSHPEGE